MICVYLVILQVALWLTLEFVMGFKYHYMYLIIGATALMYNDYYSYIM